MITNKDNIIDSRDIIEHIAELEMDLQDFYMSFLEVSEQTEKEVPFEVWLALEESVEKDDYMLLKSLAKTGATHSCDWEFGAMLIHEDYFEEYVDEMVEECYDIPKNLPYWMSIEYDYCALRQYYTTIDFDGETYYMIGG